MKNVIKKIIPSLLAVLLFLVLSHVAHVMRPEPKVVLPMHVIVYDRSRKEVVTYEATPMVQNGALHICDATVLQVEDVSQMVE